MSTNDDNTSGIPTRAIHEAYLDMQRALKRYRRATDKGSKEAIQHAHGDVQETVLTLYELLRPHLKHNDAVDEYWDGEPPAYPHDETAPDPEDGKGVLAVQDRTGTFDRADLNGALPEDPDLSDWHDAIGLNGTVRLTAIRGNMVAYQSYELGLRKMDSWETEYRTTQTELGGFMGSVKTPDTTRQRVDMPKLRRAARELADVMKEIGYLPESDIPDNEDPLPI